MSKTTDFGTIDPASVEAFRGSFRGNLICPTDAGYEEHRRVWNASIDRPNAWRCRA